MIEDHYNPEYADYIMEHGDRQCGNGDMLIDLMADGYLWDEFCAEKGIPND